MAKKLTEETKPKKTDTKGDNATEKVAAKTAEKVAPKAADKVAASQAANVSSKKRLDFGILHVQSTFNNTKVLLTDKQGNAVFASSAGALGFKGAKKGTPFAAAKVGETLAIKAQPLGLKEIAVVVKGVGSGRESAIRGFISKGVTIASIQDSTPVPFNGPKSKKPRRV